MKNLNQHVLVSIELRRFAKTGQMFGGKDGHKMIIYVRHGLETFA